MNRLENLGDYGIVVKELHNCGGSAAQLYKDIGDTAVAEKAPELLTKGGIIGGVTVLVVGFGTQLVIKGVKLWKERKKKLAEKPKLEEQLARQMVNASESPGGGSEETGNE